MNRNASGRCIVTNTAGAEGEAAAERLQNGVRQVDEQIQGLDDDAVYTVSDSGIDGSKGEGQTATGAQIKETWAKFDWVVTSELPTFDKQGDNAGAFTWDRKTQVLEGINLVYNTFYTTVERYNLYYLPASHDLVSLHELAHFTRYGRSYKEQYGRSLERIISLSAYKLSGQMGGGYDCAVFGVKC